MGRKIEPLAEQADDALIAFLRAELALGFTYVQTAKVESGFDSKGQKRAITLAKDALETIHRFRDRITDPAVQLELQNGADELEKLLSSRAPHI